MVPTFGYSDNNTLQILNKFFAKNINYFLMKAKTIEEIYKKKSQLEHILDRPDTYVGKKSYIVMWISAWLHEQFLTSRFCGAM